MKKRLVVGISGASGASLGIRLLLALRSQPDWEAHLVCSKAAKLTIEHETDMTLEQVEALADVAYRADEVGASPASGTFRTEGMVVIPCSMKTLAGIACGYADNLLGRAADVTLKERRKLVLVARETPLHLGHLRNFVRAAEIGAVIMPPVMTHYIKPDTIEDMERHTVAKVLAEVGIDPPRYKRWQGLDLSEV